jgi:tetratricopeptide (TPR) repeat protein
MNRIAVAWRLPILIALALCALAARSAEPRGGGELSRAASRCTQLAELIACSVALNGKPNDPDLLVAEADALVRLNRPGEAIGVYRNALTVAARPDAVDPKIDRAQSLRQSLLETCLAGTGEAAEHACASAWLPGAADEVTVFKRRGLLLQGMGQPSAALDAYLAAARLRPRDRSVAYAIVKLSGSVRAKDAGSLTALGSAQLTLGHPAEALEPLRQALRLAPDLATAKERLRVAERTIAANAANAQMAAQTNPALDHGATDGDGAVASYSNDAEITRSN